MTQSLCEQELLEANTWLLRFLHLENTYSLLLGGLLACGCIGLPLLAFQIWLTGSGSLSRLPLIAVILVLAGTLIFIIRRVHLKNTFNQIKSRVLKLQRAGFVVYKKPVFLNDILGASAEGLPNDASPINFEALSPDELRYIFS